MLHATIVNRIGTFLEPNLYYPPWIDQFIDSIDKLFLYLERSRAGWGLAGTEWRILYILSSGEEQDRIVQAAEEEELHSPD